MRVTKPSAGYRDCDKEFVISLIVPLPSPVDVALTSAVAVAPPEVTPRHNNAPLPVDPPSEGQRASAAAMVIQTPTATAPMAPTDLFPKDVWLALADIESAKAGGRTTVQISTETLIPVLAYLSHDAQEVNANSTDARISSFLTKGAFKNLMSFVEAKAFPKLGNLIAKVVGKHDDFDKLAKLNYDCPGDDLIRVYTMVKDANVTSSTWGQQGGSFSAPIHVIDYVAMHVAVSTLSSVSGDILNGNVCFMDELQIRGVKNALNIMYNNTGQCSFHIATAFGDAQTNQRLVEIMKRQDENGPHAHKHGYTQAGNFHGGLVNERVLSHIEDELLLVFIEPYEVAEGWSGVVKRVCTAKQLSNGECDGEKYAVWIKKDMFKFIFKEGQHLAITSDDGDDNAETPTVEFTTNTSPAWLPAFARWLFLHTSNAFSWVIPIQHRFKHAHAVAVKGVVHHSWGGGILAMIKKYYIIGILNGLCPSFLKYIMRHKRLCAMLFSDVALWITLLAGRPIIEVSKLLSTPGVAAADGFYKYSKTALARVTKLTQPLHSIVSEATLTEWAMPYLKVALLFSKPFDDSIYYLFPPPVHNMLTGQASIMVPLRSFGCIAKHLAYVVNVKIPRKKGDAVLYRGRICKFADNIDDKTVYLRGYYSGEPVLTEAGDQEIPVLDMHVLMVQEDTLVKAIVYILTKACRDPINVPR